MRVLRVADYRVMPWANGGGVTREVAVSPEGFTPAECDWRVSIATVSEPGPFSSLPEVDRALLLIDGGEMHLLVDGAEQRASREQPLLFRGESSVECLALPHGETTDLNLMTRRGRFVGTMAVLAAGATVEFVRGETVVLMPLDADVSIQNVTLHPLDAAILDAEEGAEVAASLATEVIEDSGRVACMRISRARAR